MRNKQVIVFVFKHVLAFINAFYVLYNNIKLEILTLFGLNLLFNLKLKVNKFISYIVGKYVTNL